MTDKELIIYFLNKKYNNDHPIIFNYVKGQLKGQFTSVKVMIKEELRTFSIDKIILCDAVFSFLEKKKTLYKKGLIQVKPLYFQP